jgi:thiamine biosynthesis lipoprotein
MRDAITRRRAIRVLAAAAGLPLLAAGVRATVPTGRFFGWQGEVLGAASELTLWHWDEALARRAILKVRHEIERYERIFSLYRDDSAIVRLNRDGALVRPSPELVEVIDASQGLGVLSNGAFDITVQPLWRVYEEHFWSCSRVESDIASRALDVARTRVDFRRLQPGTARIDLALGMGVTLNGIAQGYVTDRIADLLRHEGFEQAMVDLGEFRALGKHPEDRAWRAGLRGGRTIELSNEALAVSGGYGTIFEPSGRFHHIFDPASGASANALREVAVVAPRAMIADGLATAICVAGEARAPELLAPYDARAIVTRLDGTPVEISPTGTV